MMQTNNISSTMKRISNKRRISELELMLKFEDEKKVRAIFQSGIEMSDIRLKYGKTFWHVFAINKDTKVIQLLDEFKIEFDVNALDDYGRTALYYAANRLYAKQVRFLLEHGADPNLLFEGKSILQMVATMMESYPMSYERHIKPMKMIVQLLLQYGADTQDFALYCDKTDDFLRRIIISHMVYVKGINSLCPTMDTPRLRRLTYSFRYDCIFAIRELEKMENFKIHKSVTFFQLLFKTDDQLISYARNQEFMLAFKNKMKKIPYLESYFTNILEWRFAKAEVKLIERIELERKAAPVIEELSGLCSDTFKHIVFQILSYLDFKDLQNVCTI